MYFLRQILTPFATALSLILLRFFCYSGDRGENSPQCLHLVSSCWDFGSSSTNEFVNLAAACATKTMLSFQCQQCGGCSPTLTLLPGRPTTQMLLLATTPLSSWPFGASQMGYGNDCHSYPNSELSNNSWSILGSHYCLSRDKSLFCFPENFPWASGWKQGMVYRKPNLASRVEDSLGSHWLSLRAAVFSSEHPGERQRQPRTSCVWWRASLWICAPTGIISVTCFCYCPVERTPTVCYPPHRKRFCNFV